MRFRSRNKNSKANPSKSCDNSTHAVQENGTSESEPSMSCDPFTPLEPDKNGTATTNVGGQCSDETRKNLENNESNPCGTSTQQKQDVQADEIDTENVGSGSKDSLMHTKVDESTENVGRGSKDSLLHIKVDESRADQVVMDISISKRSTADNISLQTRDVSQAMNWNCGSDALAQSSSQTPKIKEIAIIDQPPPKSRTRKLKQKKKRKEEDMLRSKLREADRHFMSGQFDEALTIYRGSVNEAKKRMIHGDQTAGDIHVMMSTIFQGKNEPESAIECLKKAKSIFMEIHESTTVLENCNKTLGQKLIEVNACLANLYTETGKIEEASIAHRETIDMYHCHFRTFTQLQANLLNNYAFFLSNCLEDHKSALRLHREAFDAQKKNDAVNGDCATTLHNMGRTYLRLMECTGRSDRKKSAQKAIFCFEQALRIYRLSLVKNDNEKILQTVFLLDIARSGANEEEEDCGSTYFTASSIDDEWEYYEEMTVTGDSLARSYVLPGDLNSTAGTFMTSDQSENTFDVAKRIMFACYSCTNCKGYPWY